MNTNFACSENIPRAVVIGSDGSVSPSVMKQMHVKGGIIIVPGGKRTFSKIYLLAIFSKSP
jgi:hypothetical protein